MSLLFDESPFLGASPLVGAGICYYYNCPILFGLCIFIFIALIYFYRYFKFDEVGFSDDVIVSPCEGKILLIGETMSHYYIPIFLSIFNKHYQIYPVNGTVIDRIYDHTGQFKLVMNLDKSRDNEKKIHIIRMKDGTQISITQIAGLLPRMIVSSDEVPQDVAAGDYMGMIKFGSRIDLLIPKKSATGKSFIFGREISQDASVCIGELIGEYL